MREPGRGVSTTWERDSSDIWLLLGWSVACMFGGALWAFITMSPVADFCQSPLANVPSLPDAPPSAYMLPHAYELPKP